MLGILLYFKVYSSIKSYEGSCYTFLTSGVLEALGTERIGSPGTRGPGQALNPQSPEAQTLLGGSWGSYNWGYGGSFKGSIGFRV